MATVDIDLWEEFININTPKPGDNGLTTEQQYVKWLEKKQIKQEGV